MVILPEVYVTLAEFGYHVYALWFNRSERLLYNAFNKNLALRWWVVDGVIFRWNTLHINKQYVITYDNHIFKLI
jgi:hypothetical protein